MLVFGCSGEAPVPGGGTEPPVVATPLPFPQRLLSQGEGEPSEVLLESDLTDLGNWWILDTQPSLRPAEGDPRVEVSERGVTLELGTALVRFVEPGTGVDFRAWADVALDDAGAMDAREPAGVLQVHGFKSVEELHDLLPDSLVTDMSAQQEELARSLAKRIMQTALAPKAEWITPADADGFARARLRLMAMADVAAWALVLAPTQRDTRVRAMRVERAPELDMHDRNGSETVEISEPVIGPVKIHGDRRLALAVPAGPGYSLDVVAPAGAQRLTFAVASLAPANQGVASRWRVAWRPAGGSEPVLLGTGDQLLAPHAPEAFRDVSLPVGPEVVGPGELRFTVTGNAALAFAQPTLRATQPRRARGSNLLVISIDTLRADHTGFGGYDRPTTPQLDRIAAAGVVFENHTSVGPYTLPTHASLLTGLHPLRHGAIDGGSDRLDSRSLPYLPRLLADAGFLTAAFTGGGFVSEEYGFATGFDRFHNIDPVVNPESRVSQLRYKKMKDVDRRTVEERANLMGLVDWFDDRRDERWFAFVHTYAAHRYQPPAEDFAPFDTLDVAPWGGDDLALKQYLGSKVWMDEPPTPDQVEQLVNLYDGSVRFVDRRVGEFLEALRAGGHLEDTILVITSDHGEEFFEHGGLRHSKSLYDEMLHVPLVIQAPGGMSGRRVREPVVSLDVTPTLLDLLGLPIPAGLDGRSLAAFVRGAPPDLHEPFLVGHVHTSSSRRLSLQEGPLKLIRGWTGSGVRFPAASEWELYDKSADPTERQNLVDQRGADFERLRGALESIEQVLHAGAASAEGAELSPELLRQLEELGYFGG
jgi:arylsulfatase A-like enzyme